MPRIPFNNQSTPISADFGRRSIPAQSVRINTSSLDAAFGGLHDAIRSTPKVQAEDFSGTIALGKGISDLGAAAFKLAQEEKQIDYQRVGLKFQNQLNDAHAEWQGTKETVDPNEYKQKAEELVSKTLSSVDYGNLPEDQKALLTEHADHFANTIRIDAKYATVTGKRDKLNAEYDVALPVAISSRNVQQVGSIIGNKARLNDWTPEHTAGVVAAAGQKIADADREDKRAAINEALQSGNVEGAMLIFDEGYKDISDKDPRLGTEKRIVRSSINRATEDQIYMGEVMHDPITFNQYIGEKEPDGSYKNFKEWTPERRAHWDNVSAKRMYEVDNKAVSDAIELFNSASLGGESKGPTEESILNNRDLTNTSKAMLIQKFVRREPVSAKEWLDFAVGVGDLELNVDPKIRAYQRVSLELQVKALPTEEERRGMLGIIENKFNPDDPSTQAAKPIISEIQAAMRAGALGTYRENYTPGEPAKTSRTWVGLALDTHPIAPLVRGAFGNSVMGIPLSTSTPAKPGTPIPPNDKARIAAMSDNERAKAVVTNTAKQAEANKVARELIAEVTARSKRGENTEQIRAAIEDKKASFMAGAALQNAATTFGPDNTLMGPIKEDPNTEATRLLNKFLPPTK